MAGQVKALCLRFSLIWAREVKNLEAGSCSKTDWEEHECWFIEQVTSNKQGWVGTSDPKKKLCWDAAEGGQMGDEPEDCWIQEDRQ